MKFILFNISDSSILPLGYLYIQAKTADLQGNHELYAHYRGRLLEGNRHVHNII